MSRAAWISLGMLGTLLLIAFIRQLSFGEGTMIYFPATTVTLGGESDPVLDTLREQQTPDSNQVRSLLVQSRDWQPRQKLFIARHEVTNLQYRLFLNPMQHQSAQMKDFIHPSTPADHNFRPKSFTDIKYNNNRQPVVNTAWQDAYGFCRFSNMRLPSSEEFEAAFRLEAGLRAPDEFDFPVVVGTDQTAVVPIEVGMYRAQKGVFQELIGNAMEWVQPAQGQHFLMGYSYKQISPQQKAFHPFKRHFASANERDNDFGFRCVYPAPPNFQANLLRTQTVNRDGLRCWRTRDNLGPGRFDLITPTNQKYYGGGMMFPDELCELPQKPYRLGADAQVSTVELIAKNPWGYADYLLGKPATKQKLKAFKLDIKEVSIKDYKQFLNRPKLNDRIHSHPEEPAGHDHTPHKWTSQLSFKDIYKPVTGVSWWDAFAYCTWQNKRLPFSTEWESAAKSNDGRLYAWGNDVTPDKLDRTPQGLVNMTRSVSEWTATLQLGSNSAIVKGGSELFDWPIFGRSYVELKLSRSVKSPAVGFRCAR